ncbi:MAG: 3-phosphoglycerate dehydrogenase [Erysipelotrichaceae bacterium]|nr:3-phosphoglycerate dehydrogenase [Erysipelotrichaceae bacterium]
MYRIKTINDISQKGLDNFGDEYEVGPNVENEDAILVRSAKLHNYDFPKSIKAVARCGAGVNNIPIDELRSKGIVVFNTPGANANAVKELVICGMLLGSRRILEGIAFAKDLTGDDYTKRVEQGKNAFVGPELDGKKLGVIGLGAIGVEVANAATKLGMHVYGYDPYMSVTAAWGLSKWVHRATLDQIFKECDYITAHVPLNDETKNMFNTKTIATMKDGVVLLNFARDELVDEDAILEGVHSGKIARYVTDFGSEVLAHTRNVIVFPHLGASTPESEDNCATMAVEEIKDYLENGNIVNSVNFPRVYEPRVSNYRVCVIHVNQPGILSQFTAAFGHKGMNIDNMLSRHRGGFAYTMIDTNDLSEDITKEIESIEGVVNARFIQKAVF